MITPDTAKTPTQAEQLDYKSSNSIVPDALRNIWNSGTAVKYLEKHGEAYLRQNKQVILEILFEKHVFENKIQ